MRAVLIDDEPLALKYLEMQLEKVSNIEILKTFTFFNIDVHHEILNEVDLLFLDIEMPEKNGLELAEQILEVNQKIEIVFVTAFDQYAVKAFELHALDYILKPVQSERLRKTLSRLTSYKVTEKQIALEDDYLYISVLGSLMIGSQNINWRTTKAEELFLYLLQHESKRVRKADLVKLLWSGFQVDNGYSQLYTAIYHIRRTLRMFSDYLTIKNVHDSYVLDTRNIVIDSIKWEAELVNGPSINEETISFYEKIMAIYNEPYLSKYEYLWAESERFRMEQLWVNYAKKIAKFYKKQGKLEDAVRWYTLICEKHIDDEDAHFALMQLYDQLKYGMLVHHQYKQLEENLKQIDLEVSPHIEKWYQSLNQ